MALSYDKLWKQLIDKKLKRTDLITDAHISSNALAKMGKDESVSLETIEKICHYLDCDINDIVTLK